MLRNSRERFSLLNDVFIFILLLACVVKTSSNEISLFLPLSQKLKKKSHYPDKILFFSFHSMKFIYSVFLQLQNPGNLQ